MSEPLVLGPFVFQDFEVPERVTAGGSQRLVVHALPGGGRVVDAMGADEADIRWAGTFAGAEAPDRARALDALRMAGGALPLVWGAAFYTVAIASFEAEYRSPWWVPYRVRCTVLRNEGAALAGVAADLLAPPGAAADLASAAGYAAVADVGGADAQIAAAGVLLGSDEPAAAVAAAGVLARVSAARGYLARAAPGIVFMTSSGGAMKTVTIAGGDLFHLAASALGDATQWVRIAALNGLSDPVLTGVITLTLPVLDASATGGLPDQGTAG